MKNIKNKVYNIYNLSLYEYIILIIEHDVQMFIMGVLNPHFNFVEDKSIAEYRAIMEIE